MSKLHLMILTSAMATGAALCVTPARSEPATPSERERVLGEFLAPFWQWPLRPQGSPPAGFSAAEASLDPQICGACHPKQHHEWRDSLHARAFSPGLAGQLIEGPLATPLEIRGCQRCHAPLAEQQPFDAQGQEVAHDPALRAQGVVCAACHVRAHHRYGPPRRPERPTSSFPAPHGGFEARVEFEEGRFCAPCHQFFDDPGIDGKPMENTFREWQESPHAARGQTCQSCHMPKRSHRFRGIHDPAFVRGAVDTGLFLASTEADAIDASLVLRSRDVGHAFPTYVTPRVVLAVWQEDAAQTEVRGTRREAVIGREVDLAGGAQLFDTRVAPGETVRLEYRAPRAATAAALVGEVRIAPDAHYQRVYASLMDAYSDPRARTLIGEALRSAGASEYVLRRHREALRRRGPTAGE